MERETVEKDLSAITKTTHSGIMHLLHSQEHFPTRKEQPQSGELQTARPTAAEDRLGPSQDDVIPAPEYDLDVELAYPEPWQLENRARARPSESKSENSLEKELADCEARLLLCEKALDDAKTELVDTKIQLQDLENAKSLIERRLQKYETMWANIVDYKEMEHPSVKVLQSKLLGTTKRIATGDMTLKQMVETCRLAETLLESIGFLSSLNAIADASRKSS
ncbi:hypothetical protein VKT23_010434 [Stygiomarasmius scandens]|uniref:Uncharacterized protein n=1 Tax=Marasmiellus scandens TaxID=2682957 RepID=A0ABR1JEA3_9AGAR